MAQQILYRDHMTIFISDGNGGGHWAYVDTMQPVLENIDRPRFRFADQPKESLDKSGS
jgi:hypothetical protein